MARLAILDAPLDCSGAGRAEERAPSALRAAGVVQQLAARDAGRPRRASTTRAATSRPA
jgi:hypothetical protein